VHTAPICSPAPGTWRPTRRIAAISCVMVSWVATASAKIVESTARRLRPARTPVASTTCRTASLIRCGRVEAANRRRQYTSVEG
jgi:inhibitor of KinA sporulation pathway (predicted exonuclease)